MNQALNFINMYQLLGILEDNNIRKQGGRYSMLCPFHLEKTPSMTIDPDEGTYHCFGCLKHGHLEDIAFPTSTLNHHDFKALKNHDAWKGILTSKEGVMHSFIDNYYGLQGLALLVLKHSKINKWHQNGDVYLEIDQEYSKMISTDRIKQIQNAMSKVHKKELTLYWEVI